MHQEPVNTKTGINILLDNKMGIFAFIIALITFLVYIPALQNDFVNWDDDLYVYENEHIRSIDLQFIRILFTDSFNFWHPLTIISHSLDYSLWGLDPWGHHLTSILLHLFNSSLIFIIILKLIEHISIKNERACKQFPFVAAFISALLFGIHPIHVEAVAWVSGRKDLLCTFFYLLSLLAYLKFTSFNGLKQCRSYLLSIFFFILALASKPMAISLPIVLLILDFYPLGRLAQKSKKGTDKSVLIEKIPFFLFAFLFSGLTMWAYESEGMIKSLGEISLPSRIMIASHNYMFYLYKMILPLNMAPLYPSPVKANLLTVEYAGSAVLFLAIILLSLWRLRKNKLVFVVWAFFIVSLLPVIGIVQSGIPSVADRYSYLPSIAPFFIAGLLAGNLLGSVKKIKITGILAIASCLCIMSLLTVKQISYWRNSITLWSYELSLFPYESEAYFNRGLAYGESGNYNQAVEDFSQAIRLRIRPHSKIVNAYIGRGLAYNEVGRRDLAIGDLKMAIMLDRSNVLAHYNLSYVYFEMGNIKMSQYYYQIAEKIDKKLF